MSRLQTGPADCLAFDRESQTKLIDGKRLLNYVHKGMKPVKQTSQHRCVALRSTGIELPFQIG